jgi:hypothetical protein
MSKFLLSLLLLCFFSTEGIAGSHQPDISADSFFAALKIFRNDPNGKNANAALSNMAKFAEQSSEVLVEIDKKYFPYESAAISSKAQIKFLGAYIAGNVEYQLIYGVKENRPLEGVRFMLETYEILRRKNAVVRIEGFEKWKKLIRKNQLHFQDDT